MLFLLLKWIQNLHQVEEVMVLNLEELFHEEVMQNSNLLILGIVTILCDNTYIIDKWLSNATTTTSPVQTDMAYAY